MATWVAITEPADIDPIAVVVAVGAVVNSEVFAVVIAEVETSILSFPSVVDVVVVAVVGNVCAANCHFEFAVVWGSFTR